MDIHALYEEARAIAPWITEHRRALHRIPENGFEEYKTNAYIRKVLDELEIPYTCERTWIVAELTGAGEGQTVALRADIDALPVTEPEGCPFRSEHEGWMHACGHDMHTAIQLGAAKLLKAHRSELRGNVRLLFQPAEETVGGAEPMVQAGVMQGVDAVYGLHVQPYMNVGHMDTRRGTLNASTDDVDITVHGVAAHAARPEQGIDAIVCASQLVMTLQTAISRSVTPLKPAVLTFGVIGGGRAGNIVCDEVKLKGTLRTADPKTRELLKERVRTICEGTAAAFGAKIDVQITSGYCALINDDREVERVLRLGRELLGNDNASEREEPSMGGEDFSYFCAEVPGAFWHLGCAVRQPSPTLHSAEFVPDEACMPIGAAMQAALVLDRMNGV